MLCALVGLQWGDEGKGRVCDELSRLMDIVVRFNGGPNSVHTLRTADLTLQLRQLPSAILHPHVVNILGDGTVVDPRVLRGEIEYVRKLDGLDPRIQISKYAHVITPYNCIADRLKDSTARVDHKTSTWSGIASTFSDKVKREGLRMGDLLDEKLLAAWISTYVPRKQKYMDCIYGYAAPDAEGMYEAYRDYGDFFGEMITDSGETLRKRLASGASVLYEGAQGAMLDLTHGTYPYVTSSSTTAGALFTGSGTPPRYIPKIIGVFKPYVTRVGAGPFVTEERGLGARLGENYRTGWLDLVSLKHAIQINGCNVLALTNLDRLSGFSKIKVAKAYQVGSTIIDKYDSGLFGSPECRPIYDEFPGWGDPIYGVTSWRKLPQEAKAFISRLEKLLAIEIGFVSSGPIRGHTIKNNVFEN